MRMELTLAMATITPPRDAYYALLRKRKAMPNLPNPLIRRFLDADASLDAMVVQISDSSASVDSLDSVDDMPMKLVDCQHTIHSANSLATLKTKENGNDLGSPERQDVVVSARYPSPASHTRNPPTQEHISIRKTKYPFLSTSASAFKLLNDSAVLYAIQDTILGSHTVFYYPSYTLSHRIGHSGTLHPGILQTNKTACFDCGMTPSWWREAYVHRRGIHGRVVKKELAIFLIEEILEVSSSDEDDEERGEEDGDVVDVLLDAGFDDDAREISLIEEGEEGVGGESVFASNSTTKFSPAADAMSTSSDSDDHDDEDTADSSRALEIPPTPILAVAAPISPPTPPALPPTPPILPLTLTTSGQKPQLPPGLGNVPGGVSPKDFGVFAAHAVPVFCVWTKPKNKRLTRVQYGRCWTRRFAFDGERKSGLRNEVMMMDEEKEEVKEELGVREVRKTHVTRKKNSVTGLSL